MKLVIIGPDFMTFDRPCFTLLTTDFTNISSFMEGSFLEHFPDIRGNIGAYIGVPTGLGNQLNREKRYPLLEELSIYMVWNVPTFANRVSSCSEGFNLAFVFF